MADKEIKVCNCKHVVTNKKNDKICPKCGGKIPITLEVQNLSVTPAELFGGMKNG